MMSRNLFAQRIYQEWANHFHIDREVLNRMETLLLPEARLAGSNIIAIRYIGQCVLVQLDPAYFDQIKEVLASLPHTLAFSGNILQEVWGAERIQAHDWGLVHYLYPADLPEFSPAETFELRQLTLDDIVAMATLHQVCSPEEVDESYVEVDHLIAFGCFAGDQLVAAASGYERTGFMDVGVLAHPAYRQQGLGKAVVGALCEWSMAQDYLLQYRCNATNISSERLARALNFTLYFRQESVWLK